MYISKGKAQTVSSWPKVVEPTVPEAQKVEFKVTETKTVEPKGVGSTASLISRCIPY
jgi:hypothetical protein